MRVGVSFFRFLVCFHAIGRTQAGPRYYGAIHLADIWPNELGHSLLTESDTRIPQNAAS